MQKTINPRREFMQGKLLSLAANSHFLYFWSYQFRTERTIPFLPIVSNIKIRLSFAQNVPSITSSNSTTHKQHNNNSYLCQLSLVHANNDNPQHLYNNYMHLIAIHTALQQFK
jgi:hypothetical protein